jgi:GrpB-like predicted nucleotidyltransferase (UPF0157 family)
MDLFAETHAVELVDHSPEWAALAASESLRLSEAIGDTLIVIHHIGSTAIPSIKAKPVIDLLPLVKSLDALDARESAVTALGYAWRGEFGLVGRRYLCKTVGGKRLVNVHCYQEENPGMARHLAFRDYLRAHPAIAKEYEVEKIRAAKLQPNDVLAYNDAKNDWIKDTEKKAIAWYGGLR